MPVLELARCRMTEKRVGQCVVRATLANGCMWYLPGTHLMASFRNVGDNPHQTPLIWKRGG